MVNYPLIFSVSLLVNGILTLRSSGLSDRFFKKPADTAESADSKDPLLGDTIKAEQDKVKEDKRKHQELLRKYLVVYLLAVLSDWLQGPYVYALYDDYGYNQHMIAVLFVAGFGSSMVFGSFIGGMADQHGRRKFVILFTVIYALSCCTKHFKNFHILMLGRLLGGVATSLLFSVFDAWLIRSHADAGISSYLGKSFSSAMYGNGIIAILSGIVANKAASSGKLHPFFGEGGVFHIGGYVLPFDMALVALVVCGFMAAYTWEENYGGTSSSEEQVKQRWYSALKNAAIATGNNTDILLCGTIASLFEGSMYIFVFMWTPAMTSITKEETGEENPSLPFGLIFSTFMVCCMAGSSLFSIVAEKIRGEVLAVGVFAVSSLSMCAMVTSNSGTVSFCSMNLFEFCVGMYWPVMGTMKGSIVPEDKRAAIYNLFRIPLNFIVLTSLLTDLTPAQSFKANAGMLGVASILQFQLMKRRSNLVGAKRAERKNAIDDNEYEDSVVVDEDEAGDVV